MYFYKLDGDQLTFPRTKRENLEVGKLYNLNMDIEHGEFENEKQAYFYEYNIPYSESLIMTNPLGKKAFAVTTNDSVRDDFPQYCLAKILIREGNYFVYGYAESVESTTIHFLIMEVVSVFPKVSIFNDGRAVNVKIVRKFSSDDILILDKFEEAVQHMQCVMAHNLGDYLTPKYSFNPGRIVTTRLFQRDETGDIVSFLDSGQKLILNKSSLEKFKDNVTGALVDNIFLRCFYSKKHKDKDKIFVDGTRVSMIWENDLPNYIQKSNLSTSIASNIIKKIIISYGNYFYAVTNMKGEIRPIYHTTDGFATFPLNDHELDYVKGVHDLSF